MPEARSLPTVSVIVAARDPESLLTGCLSSLLRTDYPVEKREILVVDNGLTESTCEFVKKLPVAYVREDRRGASWARNSGIRASRGGVVAFTDPDCVVTRRWLNELVTALEPSHVGIVGGAIVGYPGSSPVERYSARRASHHQDIPLQHPFRPYVMTPNLAIRRQLLDECGLFDTAFPGGGWEDADLCWRVQKKRPNLAIEYAPRAVVFHRYRTNARGFLNQHFRYGYGLGLLCRKYRSEFALTSQQRRQAYKELGQSVSSLIFASLRTFSAEAPSREVAYLDFLRQLGQQSGYMWGSFRGRLYYARGKKSIISSGA